MIILLDADWLTVTLLSFISLMYPRQRIQRKNIVTSQSSCRSLYTRPIFDKNVDGRHIAKNRHIAMPGISQMRNPQGMIRTKYLKDRLIIVGGEAI